MGLRSRFVIGALVAVALMLATGRAAATTMIRQGLETLTADNSHVVLGRVLDVHSYWNENRDFIFTDVKLRPSEWLKGQPGDDFTLTIMGGTVGDVTVLIVGGPELIPGSDYMLFLSRAPLAAGRHALTVRDLVQGVFEIRPDRGRIRAVSQALRHPLLPDENGLVEPPGGATGFAVDELVQSVRQLVRHR